MNAYFYKASIAIGVLASLAMPQVARAYDCDVVDRFANKAGALSFYNYGFIAEIDGATKLRAPLMPTGDCQISTLLVTSKDPALTTDVGDGFVARDIAVRIEGLFWKYSQRFEIEAPRLATQAIQRSVTLRDVEFTPNWEDATQTPGLLKFALLSYDGGYKWNMYSRMSWVQNGTLVDLPVASFLMPEWPNHDQQKVEVRWEYSAEYFPATRKRVPKLKVIFMRPDGTTLLTKELTLPLNMAPVKQRQGLLQQTAIPQEKLFVINNKGLWGS